MPRLSFRRSLVAVVVSWVSCAAVACGGGGGGAPASSASHEDPLTLCTTYCQRLVACDRSTDEGACTSSCTGDAELARVRPDLVPAAKTCVSSSACSVVVADDVVSSCVRAAADTLSPSQAASRYCTAMSEAEARCGGAFDEAGCLDAVKLYADGALEAGAACAERACGEVVACVRDAFGGVTPTADDKAPSSTSSRSSGR